VGRFFACDERRLAEALLGMLDRPPEPAVAKACRTRAAQFSTERATTEYLRLYGELLDCDLLGTSADCG
jgi:hypothetical protein